jgi:hypothetical protein
MLSPLYGQLSPLRVPTKAVRKVSDDADANAYLLAVESADGQELEGGVITAVESFVVGCKADGIWSAIKASCILAGARTLSGALVPLVGTAPTNANFVSGDYNRETGLKGNGSTKYLNSNRNNNTDPQNSRHMAVFRTTSESRTATRFSMATPNGTGMGQLVTTTNLRIFRSAGADYQLADTTTISGFWGHTRNASSQMQARYKGSTNTSNIVSQLPLNVTIQVFARSGGSHSDAQISFYSIGEHLDLALLDTRVSTLMTDLAAAI